jgi:Uma2 family endonuclease
VAAGQPCYIGWMQLAVPKPMTREQFLAWEVRQELRYEFDGFQPVAMTGGTAAHSAIQHNLHIAIGGRLRGTRCRFHGSDLKIETAKGFRYPDGFIVCNPVPPHATIVGDPVVIFEVLSDSTASTDLVTKNHEYAAIPSVRRYVVLAQDEMAGSMFERANNDWIGRLLNADSVLHMPEIGIEIALAELYGGVEFPVAESVPQSR